MTQFLIFRAVFTGSACLNNYLTDAAGARLILRNHGLDVGDGFETWAEGRAPGVWTVHSVAGILVAVVVRAS